MSHSQTVEEAKSAQIRFPAIWFENGFATALVGPIQRASRLGLKKSSFKNATIVDASGNRFRITGVRKVRTLFSWRAGKIIELVAGNPECEVEWTFGVVSKISLDDVKALLFKALRTQREFWEEMIDIDEFKSKISSAGSFDLLFGVLKEFNFLG